MKKRNTKIIVAGVAGVALLLIVAFYYYSEIFSNVPKSVTPASSVFCDSDESTDYSLVPGDSVQQTFINDDNGVKSIDFHCTNFSDNSTLSVTLKEADGKNVQNWICKASEDVKVRLKKAVINHKQYILVIENHSDEKVNVKTDLKDSYPRGTLLTGNGDSTLTDLIFKCTPPRQSTDSIKKMFVLTVFLMLLGLVGMGFALLRNNIPLAGAIFVFLIGSAYLLVLPPWSAPDEPSHFLTAYRFSDELLGVKNKNMKDGVVPVRNDDNNDILGQSINRSTYLYVSHGLGKRTSYTKVDQTSYHGVAMVNVSPIAYAPQFIGLSLGRLLKLNYISILFLASYGSLIYFAIMMYIALCIIPTGKEMMIVLAGLPMIMQQATAISYDITVIGMAYVSIAFILKLALEDRQLGIKDLILLSVMLFILGPCKFVYFTIAFLTLIIHGKNFRNRWQMIYIKVVVPVVTFILAFAQNMKTIGKTAGKTNWLDYANEEGYSVDYIKTHIPHMISLAFNTIHDHLSMYLDSTLGVNLGWFNIPIHTTYIYAILVLLVLSLFVKQKISITGRTAVACEVIFFATAGIVILSMLMSWTPLSSHAIEGVQGRYFLPVLPLMLLPLLSSGRNEGGMVRLKAETAGKRIIMATGCVNYFVVLRIFETIMSR